MEEVYGVRHGPSLLMDIPIVYSLYIYIYTFSGKSSSSIKKKQKQKQKHNGLKWTFSKGTEPVCPAKTTIS